MVRPTLMTGALRVAYLVNHYPKVSHSFIRREIQALERQDVEVLRFSVRGHDDTLVDPGDLEERKRTEYVLRAGALRIVLAVLGTLVGSPARFLGALRLALRMARRAERPLPLHLVYLAEACFLARRLRGRGVMHLHAHFGTNSAEVAMLVRELGGPPFSFTVHGPEEFDKPEFLGLARKIEKAAFVVAISSFGRSQLYRQTTAENWPKIEVVHCGLEPAFHEGAASAAASAPRLVCVGRLCEQKGQLLLLDAARRLAAEGVSFELVLAGDGEMRPEIERRIRDFGLAEHVKITGWISSARVREEILASRALVMPSFAEGLPVAIMESMALGRPVLSTYVAGIPELVREERDGWLVPAGDAEALAAAMKSCLDASEERLLEMGTSARERVLLRHDIDREAAKLRRAFGRSSAASGLP